MIFFLEIDLVAGDITETIGRRSEDRLVGREFDTPWLKDQATNYSPKKEKSERDPPFSQTNKRGPPV